MRNRVVRYELVEASRLKPYEGNNKRHSEKQRAIVGEVLERIGFIQCLVVNQDYVIIDGHLRADIAKDELVPVLVVDVDDVELDELNSVLDYIANMAEDGAQFLALEAALEVERLPEVLRDFVGELAGAHSLLADKPDIDIEDFSQELDVLPERAELVSITCPCCGRAFSVRSDHWLLRGENENQNT